MAVDKGGLGDLNSPKYSQSWNSLEKSSHHFLSEQQLQDFKCSEPVRGRYAEISALKSLGMEARQNHATIIMVSDIIVSI